MQHKSAKSPQQLRARAAAFTLVEMLVAVALVLLMMSLFAEVFTLATGTMSRQKGLAENDQRARMVATLLGSDFRKRTFRDVVPYFPGMDSQYLPAPSSDRSGYLSYSENNPTDDTDDVLRLTIDASRFREDMGRMSPNPEDIARDDFYLYGRATKLDTASLLANPNQPEGDDGLLSTANGVGQSRYGEVVWFLRGGNLYRRLMLIRQPYRTDIPDDAHSDPTFGNPPSSNRLIAGDYPGARSFWNDFDYSAYFNPALGCVQFHGPESLNNTPSQGANPVNLGAAGILPVSLGIPIFRFGYSQTTTTLAPREYDQAGAFFGSFTHGETSQPLFKTPGMAVTYAVDDPYTRSITLNTSTNSISPYGEGPRIGEDLLLSNVVSFDIKIWDPGVGSGPDDKPGFREIDDDNDGSTDNPSELGAVYPWSDASKRGAVSDDGTFMDLGHDTNTGFFYRVPGNTNATNTNYGNRFDTWHPLQGLTDPPYFPARYVPDGTQLGTNCPSRKTQIWQPNFSYTAGQIVLPTSGNMTAQGLRYAYQCVGSGISAAGEPIWSASDFKLTSEQVSGGAIWRAIPNLMPVRALQIKIRYLDVSSSLLKDLTLIQSLRDDL